MTFRPIPFLFSCFLVCFFFFHISSARRYTRELRFSTMFVLFVHDHKFASSAEIIVAKLRGMQSCPILVHILTLFPFPVEGVLALVKYAGV